MPFSNFLPLGLLLMIAGTVTYFVTKRQKKIWLALGILGGLISLGALGVISLAVNRM